jgi:hypothetical protein
LNQDSSFPFNLLLRVRGQLSAVLGTCRVQEFLSFYHLDGDVWEIPDDQVDFPIDIFVMGLNLQDLCEGDTGNR